MRRHVTRQFVVVTVILTGGAFAMNTDQNAAEQSARVVTLREAIAAEDQARVEGLLREAPALASATTDEGVSLILFAKYRGLDAIAKQLAAVRTELSLFEASALGDLDRVRAAMASEPAVVSHYSADGFTALHLAAFFRNTTVARFLLANGADVEATARNNSGVRPLHSAAATRDPRIVQLILSAGADPDSPQRGGFTALHSAAKHGDLRMATLLLAAGADPALTCDDGRSAFSFAQAADAADVSRRLRQFATTSQSVETDPTSKSN